MNVIRNSMQKFVKVIPNRSGQVNREHIEIGIDVLMKGGIVALPTDTLYGLAARVEDSKALDKIYEIKGRDISKPLAIAISTLDELSKVAKVSELQMRAAQQLLPGPVTILLERSDLLNKNLNPNHKTIGVRVIDHNLMLGIAHVVGPLALTSANRSGSHSPIAVEDFEELWPVIDQIFDQGPLQRHLHDDRDIRHDKLGSTVVDLTTIDKKYFTIIRDGLARNRIINVLLRLGIRLKQ